MKKQVVFFILMLVATITNAQTSIPDFWFHYAYPNEWGFTGTSVLELVSTNGKENSAYLIAVCDIGRDWFTYESECTYPAKILKISSQGELMDELTLGEEGCRSVIYKLWLDPTNPNYCLAVGKVHDNDLHYDKPFLVKFDHGLNIQWQRTVELPEEYKLFFFNARVLMDNQGDIVFCTSPYEGVIPLPTFYVHRLFLRLSPEGELLAFGPWPEATDLTEGGQGALFEYLDENGNYGQFVQNFLVRMNRDFEPIGQQEIPSTVYIPNGYLSLFYMNNSYVLPKYDGSLIVGCTARGTILSPSHDADEGALLFIKLDANDNIVNMSYTGSYNDSVDMICVNQGIANHGEDEIYFCANQCDNYSYSQLMLGINSFVVTKTDGEANILWQRFIHDDIHYFQAVAIETTVDGDCLVTGNYGTYDDGRTQTEEVFLCRISADGSLDIPQWESLVKPFSFWPNPVQDAMHIVFSPDVQPLSINLYDLQGHLVRSQTAGLQSLDMEGLPHGTYTMSVTLDNGKTFTDKVVKK